MENTTVSNSSSTRPLDSSFLSTISTIGAIVGLLAFLMNLIILSYICRLLLKKKSSFLIQLIFVSLIDSGAGLSLMLVTIHVAKDAGGVDTCALFAKTVIAFSYMSKGNILCVAIQRFIFAVHLRSASRKWRTSHTLTIAFVNISIGVVVGLIHRQGKDFLTPEMPTRTCSAAVLITEGDLSSDFLVGIGFGMVVCADVLCVLTIVKLLGLVNYVRPSQADTSSGSVSDTVFQVSRSQHRHAIVTVSIILFIYTVSSLPMLIQILLEITLNMYFTPAEHRVYLLVTYATAVSNPFLIIWRTKDLRRSMIEDISSTFHRIRNICSNI